MQVRDYRNVILLFAYPHNRYINTYLHTFVHWLNLSMQPMNKCMHIVFLNATDTQIHVNENINEDNPCIYASTTNKTVTETMQNAIHVDM